MYISILKVGFVTKESKSKYLLIVTGFKSSWNILSVIGFKSSRNIYLYYFKHLTLTLTFTLIYILPILIKQCHQTLVQDTVTSLYVYGLSGWL
jgi:hypothetical protein